MALQSSSADNFAQSVLAASRSSTNKQYGQNIPKYFRNIGENMFTLTEKLLE